MRLERGFIDLTALAILAGYKFHSKNMTAMGVQVIGTLLNETVSTGDDLWGIRWKKIPAVLQCYALGNIRFGFITYNVLAGLLLRDVFPDPDVLCRYLDCTQLTAVNWFLEFVLISLEGVEYHQVAEEAARSRTEMIRFRDARDKLCESPPTYVKLWGEILGSWPAVTNGGCRFLLQCRQWLPVQLRAISRAKIQWSDGRMIRLLKDSNLEYSRFGLTLEQLGDQSWSGSAPGGLRMIRPSGVKIPLVKLEWGMLNPALLKQFFIRMTRDVGFQKFYTNIYDLLRLCHLRLFDEKALVIAPVKETLNQAVVSTLGIEKTGLENPEAEVIVRWRRVGWLESLSQDGELKERSRWREDVPVVPGSKPRTGQKRSRSKSKAKPGKLKRMRLRSLKEGVSSGVKSKFGSDLASLALSQPSLGLSGVGSELGAEDADQREDVVILDENDSPMEIDDGEKCAALTPAKTGVKSKKRLSAASRLSRSDGLRTYDELIEGSAEAVVVFPDDLDFQFEIPPEVEEFKL